MNGFLLLLSSLAITMSASLASSLAKAKLSAMDPRTWKSIIQVSKCAVNFGQEREVERAMRMVVVSGHTTPLNTASKRLPSSSLFPPPNFHFWTTGNVKECIMLNL